MERVASRAHRILKPIARYRDLTGSKATIPSWLLGLDLREGEACLGIYENTGGESDDNTVVTNRGLRVYRHGDWEFVDYSDIAGVYAPGGKGVADRLTIRTHSGKVSDVLISGTHGKYQDIWEFMRFLDRVIHDLERNREQVPDPPGSTRE